MEGKKKKMQRKLWGFVGLIVAVVVVGGTGTVYAYIKQQTELENYPQSHHTSVEIEENFEDGVVRADTTTVKQVQFRNTGSSPVLLRVAYAEYWQRGGETLPEWYPDPGNIAVKNWTLAWANEWDYKDGWYYYKKVLPAGAATARILESITMSDFPIMRQPYVVARYELSFLAEAVQLSDEVTVNNLASDTVFGRRATVTIDTTSNGAVTSGSVAWS